MFQGISLIWGLHPFLNNYVNKELFVTCTSLICFYCYLTIPFLKQKKKEKKTS